MPLFTVTMKSNGSTSQKGLLSRAIHAASIAAGSRGRPFPAFPFVGTK
jgi:hypothetical protein